MGSGYPFSEYELSLLRCELFSPQQIANMTGRNIDVIYRKAKKMRVSLRSDTKYHFCKENFFDTWTSTTAYWIGFIMADGNICQNRLTLSIKYSDRGHLIKFKHLVAATNEIKRSKSRKYPQSRLRIGSKVLCESLKEKGITEAKSLTAKIPDGLPSQYYAEFVRGLLDGDGSITWRQTGQWALVLLGTENIIEFVKETFSAIYGKPIGSAGLHNNGKIWQYYIHGSQSGTAFLKWIYDGSDFFTRLDRKYHTWKRFS